MISATLLQPTSSKDLISRKFAAFGYNSQLNCVFNDLYLIFLNILTY